MGFIRLKQVKGNNYAYLVRNTWKGETSRQSVIRYLGRAYEFQENKRLFEFDFSRDFKGLCLELIKWQLGNYGFELKGNTMVKDKLLFSLTDHSLRNNKGNNVVIKSHDGFICEKNIKQLLNFKARGHEEEAGYKLARQFVEAGIDVPKQIFIWAFEKVFSS